MCVEEEGEEGSCTFPVYIVAVRFIDVTEARQQMRRCVSAADANVRSTRAKCVKRRFACRHRALDLSRASTLVSMISSQFIKMLKGSHYEAPHMYICVR